MTVITKDTETKDDKQCDKSVPQAVDFETAIAATGYGWYNIMLLFWTLPAVMSPYYKTSIMSYVVPNAECDLKLTLLDKGALNAVTYAGMISGGVFWAYISDTKGRRKIMIIGFFLDTICIICEAMSQTVLQLEIFKFLGGFIVCGPFAISMTYLMEMHAKAYRPRLMIVVGMMMATAGLSLAIIAIFTLTKRFEIYMLGFTIHPWQAFIAISAIPSFLGGVLLIFFPESPKFLMSQGQNEKALAIFQTMFSVNQCKPKSEFTIKCLQDETVTTNLETDAELASTKPQKSLGGIRQMLPLFSRPYLGLALHVFLTNFFILLSANSFRLWVPQFFIAVDNYENNFSHESISMCPVIEYSVNKTHALSMTYSDIEETCDSTIAMDGVMNNIYVHLTGIIGYGIAGLLVNWLGRKILLLLALATAVTCAILIYFATSTLFMIIPSCILVWTGSLASTSMMDLSTVCFPTTLRTMVLSLSMMIGRVGSLTGNLILPLLMQTHCSMPFVLIASLYSFAFISSLYFPNTQKVNLV